MAWSGGTYTRNNGTFTGSTVWAQDSAAGTNITTGNHDTHDQDLASGINNCLTKDGQNTPTANLPMGGFKHTGAANAAARDSYAAAGQIQDGALAWGGTSSGAANVFAFNLSPAITAYVNGMTVAFLTHQANTSTATLNINSVGATALVLQDGTALVGGEIISGAIIECRYNSSANKFYITSMIGRILAADGSLASPSITFWNDSNRNTGFAHTAENTLDAVVGATQAFQWKLASSAVNYLTATNAATGAGPILAAEGSDTDIDLALTPKGAGKVKTVKDFAINTNKFTVAASSGNTLVAGTLGVTGAATLSSTLGLTGNLTVNTNKALIQASSGAASFGTTTLDAALTVTTSLSSTLGS